MEEVDPPTTNAELQGEHVAFSPRRYQQELFAKARQGNVIVCLETGSGKTLIAEMLLKDLSFMFLSSTPYVAVFLVPTVMLVEQQAKSIEKSTGLKVGQYCGQNDNLSRDPAKWSSDVFALEVLVMTPQILLNVLQHALLTFISIKVLVFDECHHCQKNHPYACIMEEFYFKVEICKRPRILGMTASPVIRKGKSETECTQDFCFLEHMLDAKIITVEDRSELDSTIHHPDIEIREYNRVYHSLESLQSVMKNIYSLKEKATCMDHEVTDAKRNEQEGLERISRDLEYCLYDLGLWFARHVVSADVHLLDNRYKEMQDISKEEFFVRNVYECLNQTILEGAYEEDLRVNNLKPDLFSNKVSSLVDVLVNFRSSKIRCIVFVERIIAAKVLADFLSKALKWLRCKHVVGTHAKESRFSKKNMLETVNDFRCGLVDLLVATEVMEEGLDVQDCFLIVRFDFPKTLRSFIQSRGRARAKGSHYVILKDRMENFQEDLDTFINSEKFVARTISQRDNLLTCTKRREECDVYEVKMTGAIASRNSSIQILDRYCSNLPRDEFYDPRPLFAYVEEQNGVKCRVLLPSNACIRLIVGDTCTAKDAAKRAVCLKAIKILHAKGALTDYLLPKYGSKGAGITIPFNHQDNDEAETEYLQEPVKPLVWSARPIAMAGLICLHMYTIGFCAMKGDKKYSNFALVMKSRLPPSGANFRRIFYLHGGRTVLCKIETIKDVFLDSVQIAHAEKFQKRLFSILVDRNLDELPLKEEPTVESSWYLLVPLKKCQKQNGIQDSEIDWERIMSLKSFEGFENIGNATLNLPLEINSTVFQFANGLVSAANVLGLLVRTVYSTTLYCVIGVFEDLNAESPFPDGRFKSYRDYFESRYGQKLVFEGQNLLRARFLSSVYNTLLLRPAKGGGCSNDLIEHAINTSESSDEPERSIVELPSEICRIEYLGFHDELVNSAVILPSLMHHLEDILVATQFQELLSSKFFEGALVSVEKVLEAITTKKCLEAISLERLELLGDSFLKYAISCNLFLVHEEANEGFLSMERRENICNRMLFILGKKIELIEYIRDDVFCPKYWAAPCHPSKVWCDEKNIRDLHGDKSKDIEEKPFVACNKGHRWIQQKTVADAMEALIGACLEDGGERSALAFLTFAGLKVDISNIQIAKVQTSSEKNRSLDERIDMKAVEKVLSYTFRHKGLLVEAFTHASFVNHLGKCYQRLEFLGDSVLDFLITKHLYEGFRDAKPGDLTDLRSMLVSNESFARIVVEKELYCHLIENSPPLAKCIKKYLLQLKTIEGLEGDKCPKVLGDILESLAGAVLVDSDFNLVVVWKVFGPILQPLISEGRIQLHPVRELLEICQKRQLTCEESLVDLGQVKQFSFKITVDKKFLCGIATSTDKKSAKRQAAADAVSKLKALGFVHPIRCEASSSDKQNFGFTLSKKTLAEDERDEICRNSDEIWKGFDRRNLLPYLDDEQKPASPGSSQDSEDTSYGTVLVSNARGSVYTYAPQDNAESSNLVSNAESNARGTVCTYTPQDNAESSKLVSNARQSINQSKMPCPDTCFVNDVSLLNVCPSSTLGKGHSRRELDEAFARNANQSMEVSKLLCPDTCLANGLSSIDVVRSSTLDEARPAEIYEACAHHQPMKASEKPCPDTRFVDSFSSLDVKLSDTLGKGRPRADLYEACARNGWKDVSFFCSSEEGLSHDKWYTYKVVLQLPSVGEVECDGDPRRTTKQAMDSAAAELLKWLEFSGHL